MPIASPAPQSASLPVSVPASAVPDPLKTPTSCFSSRTKTEAVPNGAPYEEAGSNPQQLTQEAAEAQCEERKIK